MTDRLPTKKYTISVEGETEMWYFDWLEKQINACKERTYNASIDVNVHQSPKKFYKRLNAKTARRELYMFVIWRATIRFMLISSKESLLK